MTIPIEELFAGFISSSIFLGNKRIEFYKGLPLYKGGGLALAREREFLVFIFGSNFSGNKTDSVSIKRLPLDQAASLAIGLVEK